MHYKNALKELRKNKGLSQKRTAEALGISDSSYQYYEYGDRDIPGDVIKKARVFFDVTSDELLGIVPLSYTEDDGYADVQIYGSIAAGIPLEMNEICDSFPIPKIVKEAHENSGLLYVVGGSYNKKIPDGYLALIDFDLREPNEHDGFAVCVNGYSATLKHVKKLENGIELIPDSYDPTCLPITYDYNKNDTEVVTIIGKVVWATMPFNGVL